MATKSQKPDTDDAKPGAEDIEAQIARVRAELARLGGIIADFGGDRLRGAEMQAVEELQRQLSMLESGIRRKMHDQPLQVLGLAALAGLVLGLMLRR